jgi:uncharacterized membrane protein
MEIEKNKLQIKLANLQYLIDNAIRNNNFDSKKQQLQKDIENKLLNFKLKDKDSIQRKIDEFQKILYGQRIQKPKHHHDLEEFIKQGKDGAENMVHKNEYIMDEKLARNIFGKYFEDYEKKKKEAQQKKDEEKKPEQLYDLNLLPRLKEANKAINEKMTDAFDNLKRASGKVPPLETNTAFTWYILVLVILISIFSILLATNAGNAGWLWIIPVILSLAGLIFVITKYPEKSKWFGYTSIPLVAVLALSLGLFAFIFYTYSYIKKTAMFPIYGSIINTVFAILSTFIILFIFATVKVVDFRNIIGDSEKDTKDGTSRAVNVLKEYIKYSLSLFGGFALVLLSTMLVLRLTSNKEFLSMFLSIVFVLFTILTILYVVYLFMSRITLPDSPIANAVGKFFKLIYHLFFAIPCVLYEVFLNTKDTPNFVYKILAIQLATIGGYIYLPRIWKWMRERGHIVIQEEAVKLNIKKSYMNWYQLYNSGIPESNVSDSSLWEKFKDTLFKEGKNFTDYMKEQTTVQKQDFKYEYSLGLETFFHNIPPNTSHLGNQFVRVFSFGEKPSIWYKSNTQEIQFKSIVYRLEKERLKPDELVIYTGKITLQKWNKIKINYKDGVMDIFIDDELIHTQDSIVPYIENDEIYSGQTDGIHGGIRNIFYYNEIRK